MALISMNKRKQKIEDRFSSLKINKHWAAKLCNNMNLNVVKGNHRYYVAAGSKIWSWRMSKKEKT